MKTWISHTICLLMALSFQETLAQHFPEFVLSKKGHNVICMDISEEGNYFVTGGDDKKVVSWDLNKQEEHLVYAGYEAEITAVRFKKNDGNIFAAGDKAGNLTINDIYTGSTLQKIKAHDEPITSIDFNTEYDVIATASHDGTVKLWDFQTGQNEKVINANEDVVNCVRFSPDNEKFITVGADGKLKVWDYSSGMIFKTIQAHKSWVRYADFSADQNFVLTGADDKRCKIWDTQTWQKVEDFKAHSNWVTIAKFTPDNKYMVSGGFDSKVILRNLETDTKRLEFKQDGKFVSGIALTPDASRMIVTGFHENITVWNISKVDIKTPVAAPVAQHSKDINPDYYQKLAIELIQPSVIRGETFSCLEDEYTVKAKVNDPESIKEVTVNGEKVSVDEGGYFQKRIKVGYMENEVTIKAFRQNNQYVETDFILYRIFDKGNTEEVSKMERAGRDYALVIATNEYVEMPNLVNPLFDAKTIADELKNNYHFEVETLINPTKSEILSGIRQYGKRMYSDEDQLFIFIAGHGEFDHVFNDGYIVARDSKKDDDIKTTFISHSSLRTIVNSIPCKHIFLTMDVCFGGTFDPYTTRSRGLGQYSSVDKEQFIKRKMKYKTRLYLTSGGKEYVPDGRPNYHSPFARRFIAALRSYGGEDGILTFTETMSFVEKANPEPRGGEFGDNEPGSDFLFISKK